MMTLEEFWSTPVINGLDCFFSEENFKKFSYAYQYELEIALGVKTFDEKKEKPLRKFQQKKKKSSKKKSVPVKEVINSEESSTEVLSDKKNWWPFPKSYIPYPKNSTLTKAEHAQYIELHQRILKRMPLSDLNNKKFQALHLRVVKEQEEFNKFASKVANLKTSHPLYNHLHQETDRFIKDLMKCHYVRVRQYPRYYEHHHELPIKPDHANAQLIHQNLLLKMGDIPRLVLPNITTQRAQVPLNYDFVFEHYPVGDNIYNNSEVLYKQVVSQDPNAKKLAVKYHASVVISSSGLKRLIDNLNLDQVESWEIPVIVEERANDDNDALCKKIVYIDKPFIQKQMTAPTRNKWYYKHALKRLLLHPKFSKDFVNRVKMGQVKVHTDDSRGQGSDDLDCFDSSGDITDLEVFGVETSSLPLKTNDSNVPSQKKKELLNHSDTVQTCKKSKNTEDSGKTNDSCSFALDKSCMNIVSKVVEAEFKELDILNKSILVFEENDPQGIENPEMKEKQEMLTLRHKSGACSFEAKKNLKSDSDAVLIDHERVSTEKKVQLTDNFKTLAQNPTLFKENQVEQLPVCNSSNYSSVNAKENVESASDALAINTGNVLTNIPPMDQCKTSIHFPNTLKESQEKLSVHTSDSLDPTENLESDSDALVIDTENVPTAKKESMTCNCKISMQCSHELQSFCLSSDAVISEAPKTGEPDSGIIVIDAESASINRKVPVTSNCIKLHENSSDLEDRKENFTTNKFFSSPSFDATANLKSDSNVLVKVTNTVKTSEFKDKRENPTVNSFSCSSVDATGIIESDSDALVIDTEDVPITSKCKFAIQSPCVLKENQHKLTLNETPDSLLCEVEEDNLDSDSDALVIDTEIDQEKIPIQDEYKTPKLVGQCTNSLVSGNRKSSPPRNKKIGRKRRQERLLPCNDSSCDDFGQSESRLQQKEFSGMLTRSRKKSMITQAAMLKSTSHISKKPLSDSSKKAKPIVEPRNTKSLDEGNTSEDFNFDMRQNNKHLLAQVFGTSSSDETKDIDNAENDNCPTTDSNNENLDSTSEIRKLLLFRKRKGSPPIQSVKRTPENSTKLVDPTKRIQNIKKSGIQKTAGGIRRSSNPLDSILAMQEMTFNFTNSKLLDEPEDPKDYLMPPLQRNVNYNLWSLEDLSILIRCSVHGKQRASDNSLTQICTVFPKMEYQCAYGGETITDSEAVRHWISTKIRPKSKIIQARIDSQTSDILSFEEIECETPPSPKFQQSINILHKIMSDLHDLPPGKFLLTHTKGDKFLKILRKANCYKRGVLDLHASYNYVLEEITKPIEEVPWLPLDGSVYFRHHKLLKWIPATFKVKRTGILCKKSEDECEISKRETNVK